MHALIIFFFFFYIQPSPKLQGTILELMIYVHFFKAKREIEQQEDKRREHSSFTRVIDNGSSPRPNKTVLDLIIHVNMF